MKRTPRIPCHACGYNLVGLPRRGLCPECGVEYPRFRAHPLHCEGCGRDLGDVARDEDCPDCNRPVLDSLPDMKPGLPIQNARGVIPWAQTLLALTFTPRRAFNRAQCKSSAFFWHFTVLATAAIPVVLFLSDPLPGYPLMARCILGGVQGVITLIMLYVIGLIISALFAAACALMRLPIPNHVRPTINAFAIAAWFPAMVISVVAFKVMFANPLATFLLFGIGGQFALHIIGARTMRRRNHPAARLTTDHLPVQTRAHDDE